MYQIVVYKTEAEKRLLKEMISNNSQYGTTVNNMLSHMGVGGEAPLHHVYNFNDTNENYITETERDLHLSAPSPYTQTDSFA